MSIRTDDFLILGAVVLVFLW